MAKALFRNFICWWSGFCDKLRNYAFLDAWKQEWIAFSPNHGESAYDFNRRFSNLSKKLLPYDPDLEGLLVDAYAEKLKKCKIATERLRNYLENAVAIDGIVPTLHQQMKFLNKAFATGYFWEPLY